MNGSVQLCQGADSEASSHSVGNSGSSSSSTNLGDVNGIGVGWVGALRLYWLALASETWGLPLLGVVRGVWSLSSEAGVLRRVEGLVEDPLRAADRV